MPKRTSHRSNSCKTGTRKVKNWSSYNQGLKQRGSLDIWIDPTTLEHWYYQGSSQRGAQYVYSDVCITLACTFRELYHLPYRQAEGFLSSLVNKLGWEVEVPDYTSINRRHRKLHIDIHRSAKVRKGKMYVVVDSTGAKVYGEGEWKVRQHGWSKRRTWMKIHLSIDEHTGQIEGCQTTTNAVDDAEVVGALLDQANGKIGKFAGDGAYDKEKVYKELENRKIKPIIPPRRGAKLKKHGNSKGEPLPRDQNIRDIRKLGRKKWKIATNYHRRSIAETTMYRFKCIFGDHLSSRTSEHQQVEVRIKCRILNKMTELAKPEYFPKRKAA